MSYQKLKLSNNHIRFRILDILDIFSHDAVNKMVDFNKRNKLTVAGKTENFLVTHVPLVPNTGSSKCRQSGLVFTLFPTYRIAMFRHQFFL